MFAMLFKLVSCHDMPSGSTITLFYDLMLTLEIFPPGLSVGSALLFYCSVFFSVPFFVMF